MEVARLTPVIEFIRFADAFVYSRFTIFYSRARYRVSSKRWSTGWQPSFVGGHQKGVRSLTRSGPTIFTRWLRVWLIGNPTVSIVFSELFQFVIETEMEVFVLQSEDV